MVLADGMCSPWIEAGDVSDCDECGSALDGVSEETIELAVQHASRVAYLLTRQRWPGECETTIRPCGPHRFAGCGCGCQRAVELTYPVVEVSEVMVDGVALDADSYSVLDRRWLVRMTVDGRNEGWPCCQRMDLAAGELGTWSVTYSWGELPPVDALLPTIHLAKEFALACSGRPCNLPERVTTIARNGVSMTMLDPLTLFEEGRTGVALFDQWLGALRYGDTHRRATAMRPGRGPSLRRVAP